MFNGTSFIVNDFRGIGTKFLNLALSEHLFPFNSSFYLCCVMILQFYIELFIIVTATKGAAHSKVNVNGKFECFHCRSCL